MEQMAVAVALLQLLQLSKVFFDYPWVVCLRHGFIVPLMRWIGIRAHLRVCWPGVIVEVDLVPANAHELRLAEELLEDAKGWALGDRNYWSPDLAERLKEEGVCLLAPYKSKKKEKEPWPSWLVQKRRRG